MDKELQKYYEGQFDMLSSKPWADLIEDLQNMSKAYENVRHVDSADIMHYRKGQLDILDFIINRKQTLEQGYKDLTDG
jgi:hypothetical protein